jgi:hypothetical protein
MSVLKISIGIFLALAMSRFIPHPPNFTSLIALSFYIPAIIGIKFLPILLISFIITDLIIGFHGVTFFTWGTVLLIGFLSKFFVSNITTRISGAMISACLFYLITNFGVWSLGSYGYNLQGLTSCYILALPFFGNTLISTLIFSTLIEIILNRKNIWKKIV